MIKIATIIGARPQFIKAATVSRVIKERNEISEVIIHTGQHYDHNMSRSFFQELNIPEPNYNLEVGSSSHGKQTGIMMERIEQVLFKEKPNWVFTYGDTNSTIAGALCAAKLNIKSVHIEAGLRSFNRQMPEEINRIATDHISDILMAPTKNAMDLLFSEGLKNNSYFTGDVMYDSILYYSSKINSGNININIPDKYYLSTIHRPENTDNISKLQDIFSAFSELDYPVIIPLHPRTKNKISPVKFNSNIHIIEPVGYKEIIYLLSKSVKVLTDSGGLQKEAYFLKKPCITLRNQTEWVETLENNWNFCVGSNKTEIINKTKINNFGSWKNVYGDGNAAEKIIDIVSKATT